MIFYFSGTGNSLWIANEVSKYQNEKLISIGDELQNEQNRFEYTLSEDEKIGFVFPVYSWAPPAVVLHFIEQLKLINYNNQHLFFICSCGDDIGFTQKIFTKAVVKKGWNVVAGFSVIMPNNYVTFPGFDTDSKDVEQVKLSAAIKTIEQINRRLFDGQRDLFECKMGHFAFVKSYIINPLFNKYAVTDRPFIVTDKCIGCGLCQKVCPMGNVLVHNKPIWRNNCTTCLACYHICPKNAVQYGKSTKKKHQYFNPSIRKSINK